MILGRPFTNQGTLEVRPDVVLGLFGSWTNAATIRVLGGELDLGDSFTLADLGKVERTGGTIKIRGTLENTGTTLALNASTGSWVLDLPGTIHGGHITMTEGATLQVPSYGIFDGVTLDGDLTVEDGSILYVKNGLTLNATLSLASKGKGTQLWFDGSQSPNLLATFDGSGQLIFAGTDSANLLRVTGKLNIGPGLTIHGASGLIGSASQGLTSKATIIADVPGGIVNVIGSPLVNEGVMEVRSGAVLALNGDWANAGTLRVTQGELDLRGSFTTAGVGKLDRNGGVVKINGTLENTGTTLALNANTGSWVLDGGTIHGGHITFADAAALQLSSSFIGILDGVTLDSDWTIPDGATLGVNGGLTVNAALTLASATAQSRLSFGFLNSDPETLSGSGQLIFGGSGQNLVDVHAPMTIASGFTIHGGSGLIQESGYPLVNNGTIRADTANGVITIRANPFTDNGTIQELNGGKVLINP